GRLGLPGPDRFEHLEHEPGIHCRHRQLADHRAPVGSERVLPLLAMLRVPPPRFVGVDVCGCTVGECHRLCGLDGSHRYWWTLKPFRTGVSVDSGGNGQTAIDIKLADPVSAK